MPGGRLRAPTRGAEGLAHQATAAHDRSKMPLACVTSEPGAPDALAPIQDTLR